jgi:hypothetical protein
VSPPDGIVDVFRAACSRLCPARLFTSLQSNPPMSLDGVRPAPKPNAPKAGRYRAWCDGYRFATSKGKPIVAAAAKTEMKQDSSDFAAIARAVRFTARSSRYLNCHSNLSGHGGSNKPANGEGVLSRWTGAALEAGRPE